MKSNENERSRVRDYQQGQSIKNSIKRYEIACKNINEITWKKSCPDVRMNYGRF